MLFAWVLISATTAVVARDRGITARAWRRCYMEDQAAFDAESPNIQTGTTYTQSEILCSLLADMREWVEMWCYSGDTCTLWGIEALIFGKTKFNRTGPCRKRLVQCDNTFSGGGALLFEGEGPFENTCLDGYRYTCHPDGIQRLDKTAKTPISACGEQGFFSTAIGCLKIEEASMTYSAARQNCFDYGADLFHHPNPAALSKMKDIVTNHSSVGTVWYGLTKLEDDKWTWLNGRPLAEEELMLPFTGNEGELFGKGNDGVSFLAADDVCDQSFPSVCIAKKFK